MPETQKPTTPIDTPVLPGGHRMGSMNEPMAKSPVELKDTPVPSTTPEELQQGGELQGKSMPAPATEPMSPGDAARLAATKVPEPKANIEKEFKPDVIDNPVKAKATAGETKADAAKHEPKPAAGAKSHGSGPATAAAKAPKPASAGVSAPVKRGGSTRK